MDRLEPTVPFTEKRPVVDTLHGHAIVDDYRWLEGDVSDPQAMGRVTPEVAAWTDAQNAYTRTVLDALPGRAALEDRLRPLLQIGSVTAPIRRGGRYFHLRREGDQNQARVYVREGLHGEDRLLVDPEAVDPTGLTTIEWISPSPDGLLLAYGTYAAGDENTRLQLLDVDSAQALPLVIPNKVRAPAWLPSGSGFVYWNLADANDPYTGRVMYHPLPVDPGDDEGPTSDHVLFRQFTKEEDAKLATTWGPSGTLSHDGRWLLLSYAVDTRSNDLWLVEFERYLRSGDVEKVDVSIGSAGHAEGRVVNGSDGPHLVLFTYKGAPNGRVVTAPAKEPSEENWRDLVPERRDATIESVAFATGHVIVTYLERAATRIVVVDLLGNRVGKVPLPTYGTAEVRADEGTVEAFVTFSSFAHPPGVYRFDVRDPEGTFALWERPDTPIDPWSVEVRQVDYRSHDGTNVTMFLAHRNGLEPNGNAPTILSGYGGFGVTRLPDFVATLAPWFEDGGVYALPNLRGGGEYGDAWHEAGMLERKQNVFDDFVAAAEWLFAKRITRPQRLAIAGGSNGGLLTGAALTQRPDLCAAAIVAVPLLDMLRYQHFLMARYWVPEYGSAEDAEAFTWLHAYSPYHRVEDGVAYPAVLLTAGENDTRVHAMHARKMAARLQAATSRDPFEAPVLLWVDRSAGHGQGKPLDLRLRDAVDQRIFMMRHVGLPLRSD
ncbi:MAG: prolyl oligopeptidase family serine peptidase [Trueperaceae bacterium]